MHLCNDHPLVKLVSRHARDVQDTCSKAAPPRHSNHSTPSTPPINLQPRPTIFKPVPEEYGPHPTLQKKTLYRPTVGHLLSKDQQVESLSQFESVPDSMKTEDVPHVNAEPLKEVSKDSPKQFYEKQHRIRKKELHIRVSREEFPKELLSLALPSEHSDSNQLMLFLKTVLSVLGVAVQDPWLKKYKNCMVFGSGGVRIIRYYSDRVFIGSMEGTKKQGRGLQWVGQTYFVGDWADGKRNGYGIEVSKDCQYCGQWNAGVKHGQGRQISTKCSYQGAFMFGLKHGQGQQQYSNGDYYKGSYASGQYHGTGQLQRNGHVLRGEFMKGQFIDPKPVEKKQSRSSSHIIQHRKAENRFNIRSTRKLREEEVPSFDESSISKRESWQLHKDQYWKDPIEEQSQLIKQYEEPLNSHDDQQDERIWHYKQQQQFTHHSRPKRTNKEYQAEQMKRGEAMTIKSKSIRKTRVPPEHLPLYPFNIPTSFEHRIHDESSNLSKDKSTTSSQQQCRKQRNKRLLQIYYPKRINNFYLEEQSFDQPIRRRA